MTYKIINRKKRLAVKLADRLAGLVFPKLPRYRKNADDILSKIDKILVIRTAYLGDILMTLPILKPLKERWPGASITFACSREGAALLYGNSFIDRVVNLNPFWFYRSSSGEYLGFLAAMRKERFDLIIEARGDIREIFLLVAPLKGRFKVSYGFGGGAYLLTHTVPFKEVKHRVAYHLDIAGYLGCPTDRIEKRIFLSGHEKADTDRLMARHGIESPFAAVHPGARLPLKMWQPEKYARLADRVAGHYGMPVVLLGSPAERALARAVAKDLKSRHINLAGALDLRQLAGVLSRAALFLCNDSAPMHMAAAMDTPTVAVFGPSKSIETAPYNRFSRVAEKDFSCRYTCDESHCRNASYHACMKSVSVDDVFEKVRELI